MSEESAAETATETPTEEQKPAKEESHSPPEGSKRWKEMYGKVKDGERENASLQSQLMAIQSENKQTNELLKSFISKTDQSKHEELLAQSEAQLDAAREEDPEVYKKALSNYKKLVTALNKPSSDSPQTKGDPKAMSDFKAYNPWYSTNQEMTGFAHNVDTQMKADPYWNAQPDNVFLAEVAKRTVSQFSKNPATTPRLGPGSMVDGVGDSPPEETGDGKKGLSKEDKAIIKKLLPGYDEKKAFEGILTEQKKMAEIAKGEE